MVHFFHLTNSMSGEAKLLKVKVASKYRILGKIPEGKYKNEDNLIGQTNLSPYWGKNTSLPYFQKNSERNERFRHVFGAFLYCNHPKEKTLTRIIKELLLKNKTPSETDVAA